MKRIEFETLKIEGFAGIVKYKTFKLKTDGLTILRGDNGSTKTTHFSALFWALYGKSLKAGSTIETWEHVRPDNWSGTMVSVSFVVNGVKCKITRCKDYKKIIGKTKGKDRLILEEGGEESKIKSKPNLQKYIEGLLGVSSDLFLINVIFQQKGQRFIELKGPEKAKILEESFQLDWINKAKEEAKKDLDKANKGLSEISIKKSASIKSITQLKTMIQELEKAMEELENEKQQELSNLNKDLNEVKTRIKAFDKSNSWEKLNEARVDILKKIEEVKFSIDLTHGPLHEISGESAKDLISYCKKESLKIARKKDELKLYRIKFKENDRIKDNIKLYESKEAPRCKECNSILEDKNRNFLINQLKDRLKKAEEGIPEDLIPSKVDKEIESLEESKSYWDKKTEDLEDLMDHLLDISNKLDKERDAQIEYEGLVNSKKDLSKRIKEVEAKKIQDKTKPFRSDLYKEEKELEALEYQALPYQTQVNQANWAIKGPLSNSGIKSFLFDKLLDRLNQRLKFYETYTGFSIQLIVDLDSGRKSIETIVSVQGAPVDYKDLSGGESQLINVIIALASSDVLMPDVSINIRVFDEVSESLDKKNMELVAGFLKQLSETYSVFVITHSDALNVSGATEIKFKKHGQED